MGFKVLLLASILSNISLEDGSLVPYKEEQGQISPWQESVGEEAIPLQPLGRRTPEQGYRSRDSLDAAETATVKQEAYGPFIN